MANVVSVNISERKGEQKPPVPEIQLKFRHGIVGDAHAGDWHRQISLLAEESVDTMRASCPIPLDPGVFAENINTEGIDLKHLPVGTHLRIGETEVEVTQIGKECHNDCAIKKAVGKCVMPTEGIFAVVVREGTVRAGDEIEILEAENGSACLDMLNRYETKISLILPYVSTGIALATYIATNYISSLPKELDEAAIIDGCNIVQLLTKIALPLMRPILATIFIFNFQGAWSEFYWALIMIRSEENKTLQLGLMNFQSQFNTDYGVLTAGLVIATLPILIIYLKFSSQFIGGMTVGAVKG